MTTQLDRAQQYIVELRVEIDQLRVTLARWQEAFGLLTTLAPNLEIDITDPLGMARAIERHVLAERAALAAAEVDRAAVHAANTTLNRERRAAEQRAEAAEAVLAAVPVEALRRYMRYSQVPEHHHRYDAAEQQADESAIGAWLAQQSEARP